MNFNYITKEDKTKELFFKMPKQFIYEKTYKKMNDSAKILYSILYERTNLSIKNDWFDSNDRAYIICTYDEIQVLFGCSRDKVSRCMKELEKYNLILKNKIKNKDGDMINVLYIANAETTSETISSLMKQHKNEYHSLRDKNRAYKREYNKKQSELKKQKRKVESENQTTIGNTASYDIKHLKPSNFNGSLKNRLRVVRKSDYSKTDFSKTDLVVVVNKDQYKKTPKRTLTNFEKIQLNQNLTLSEKIEEIKKTKNIGLKEIALLEKFIDSNIFISDAQLNMLKRYDYKIADFSLDTTIAQGGETFSYFNKVYIEKEKEDIENFVDDFMPLANVKREVEIEDENKIENTDDFIFIPSLENEESSFDCKAEAYKRCEKFNWDINTTTVKLSYKDAIEYAKANNLEYPQNLI